MSEKSRSTGQMHQIRSGEQTIAVAVARRPTSAGIDSNHLLIDLLTDDTLKIKVQS